MPKAPCLLRQATDFQCNNFVIIVSFERLHVSLHSLSQMFSFSYQEQGEWCTITVFLAFSSGADVFVVSWLCCVKRLPPSSSSWLQKNYICLGLRISYLLWTKSKVQSPFPVFYNSVTFNWWKYLLYMRLSCTLDF